MRSPAIVIVLALGLAGHVHAQQSARGTLMIVGGGPRADDVARRFVQLAGGANGKILIFPMASGSAESSGKSSEESWQEFGIATSVSILTKDQALAADTSALFRGITAIWFPGGDQSRLTAALGGTPVESAIRNRYHAGAVVGGTSAGAAVMSQIMITGDERRIGGKRPVTDSTLAFITIDRDNIVTAKGFGLVSSAIVDQHFVRRRRHNRLISLVLENPALVGAGIDESTAIEVMPDGKWRVWGESVVVIYDARSGKTTPAAQTLGARDLRMHVLPAGSVYDLRSGKATLPDPIRVSNERDGYVITAQQIRESGAHNAWEVLSRTGAPLSMTEDNHGNPQRVRQRGNSSITLSNAPLLVVDDVQMADIRYLREIPAVSIGEIRVINGITGTARYGTGAGNGVIVVTTKAPKQ